MNVDKDLNLNFANSSKSVEDINYELFFQGAKTGESLRKGIFTSS